MMQLKEVGGKRTELNERERGLTEDVCLPAVFTFAIPDSDLKSYAFRRLPVLYSYIWEVGKDEQRWANMTEESG